MTECLEDDLILSGDHCRRCGGTGREPLGRAEVEAAGMALVIAVALALGLLVGLGGGVYCNSLREFILRM